MSAVLAIAAREIRERRFLIVTAFVVGLLPLGAGLLPSIPLEDAQDARELLGLLLGMAFPTAVALAVGSSIVGRDLAEGRLGFYFSRPISSFSVWAGKFLGGVVLLALAFLLIVGPTMIASGFAGDVLVGGRQIPPPLHIAPAFLIGTLAGAHVASTLYRARSKWIALDLLLAAATALGLWWLVTGMVKAGAGEPMFEAFPWLLVTGAASLLAAGAIQVVVGRADPLRGRRALSTALWSLVGILLLGGFGLSRWVLGTTPQDAGGVGYGLSAAPRGTGILFNSPAGGRAGYNPVFVMNGATGALTRFARDRFTIPAFSPDGQRAAWVAPPSLGIEGERSLLAVATFAGATPTVVELSVGNAADGGMVLALSPDGRALVSGPGSVALIDSVSGAVLAKIKAPNASAGWFLPDGHVRLVDRGPAGPASAVVWDWNPRSGATLERARVEGLDQTTVFGMGKDHLLLTTDGKELLRLDLALGTRSSIFSVGPSVSATHRGTVLFAGPRLGLANGGFALVLRRELVIFAADGSRQASVTLGEDNLASALSEPAAGELAVGVWSRQRGGHCSLWIDAATGMVQREVPGLIPAVSSWYQSSAIEAGSFASRLFVDDENALIELLPDGSRRVIVAGSH